MFKFKRNAARKQKTNLRQIRTIEEILKDAEEWDTRYLQVAVHSIELYGLDRQDQLIDDFLSKRSRASFKATNPHSKRIWLAEVLRSFEQDRNESLRPGTEESKDAFALVTLTHKGWACSASNIQFDLAGAKAKVRNALAGLDFIACFEPGIYRNEKWVTEGVEGDLISFHCHAIVWATRWRDLEYLRQYIRPRFEPILGLKNGARFDKLKRGEECAALAYIGKTPFLGYRTVRGANGRTTQRSTSRISFKTRWALFDACKDFSTFSFWLGGGEGVRCLADARRKTKRKVKFDPVSIAAVTRRSFPLRHSQGRGLKVANFVKERRRTAR